MSQSPSPLSAPERRPFQFRLATALIVVTGLCIFLSLAAWNLNVGMPLAVLLVGSLWTAAAVRSGWRRLAYHLASLVMGVLGYLILSLPISPITSEFLLDRGRPLGQPQGQAVLVMCFATLAGAAILRPGIRKPGKGYPLVMGLVAVYLVATLFGYCLLALSMAGDFGPRLSLPEVVPVALLFIPFAGGAIGTMSLHVAWPTAILFCLLLRRIDPAEQRPDRADEMPSKIPAESAQSTDAHAAGTPSAGGPATMQERSNEVC